MILITIDRSKCRGVYLCPNCAELAMECEQEGGEVIRSDWSRGEAEQVAARCPDQAIKVRVIE